MLYLSQLVLNPRLPHVRGDLADCRALHRRVLHAFPDRGDISAAREHFGVLYRVERAGPNIRMLVQSGELPDWSNLPPGYLRMPPGDPKRLDALYAQIQPGHSMRFRLRANPTKRVNTRASGERVQRVLGKRIELRREEEQLAWLAHKGSTNGFVVLDVAVEPGSVNWRPGSAPVADVRTAQTASKVTRYERGHTLDLAFGSVVFEGRLRVTDAEAFRTALAEGIGSAKAFGFGLLSVAPAPVAV